MNVVDLVRLDLARLDELIDLWADVCNCSCEGCLELADYVEDLMITAGRREYDRV